MARKQELTDEERMAVGARVRRWFDVVKNFSEMSEQMLLANGKESKLSNQTLTNIARNNDVGDDAAEKLEKFFGETRAQWVDDLRKASAPERTVEYTARHQIIEDVFDDFRSTGEVTEITLKRAREDLEKSRSDEPPTVEEIRRAVKKRHQVARTMIEFLSSADDVDATVAEPHPKPKTRAKSGVAVKKGVANISRRAGK